MSESESQCGNPDSQSAADSTSFLPVKDLLPKSLQSQKS